MKELIAQIKSEFLLEYRSIAQSGALLLFMWTIAYIIFRIRGEISLQEFNFVFWLIYLLVSINIAVRGANHSSVSERMFLYSILSPTKVLIARIVFNFIYLLLIGLAFYIAMLFLFYPQVIFRMDYISIIALGAFSIASVLSFISAISRHVSGQNTALSILSIPLLIPALILLYEIGANVLVNNPVESSKYIAVIGISLLSISLSLILFPYIWRE